MNHRDTEHTEKEKMKDTASLNQISEQIISSALEVHRSLGPGLLESAYEECLAHELHLRKIAFERQKSLPIEYKGIKLNCGYRLDFLVQRQVVIEVKAIDVLLPVHQSQLLTYLKLGGWRLGLLINFHVPLLKEGIKRFILGFDANKKNTETKIAI